MRNPCLRSRIVAPSCLKYQVILPRLWTAMSTTKKSSLIRGTQCTVFLLPTNLDPGHKIRDPCFSTKIVKKNSRFIHLLDPFLISGDLDFEQQCGVVKRSSLARGTECAMGFLLRSIDLGHKIYYFFYGRQETTNSQMNWLSAFTFQCKGDMGNSHFFMSTIVEQKKT